MGVPAFSRVMLMRKVHGQQLATLWLSASEYFVLDLMVQNMESRQMELVLGEVEKQYKKKIGKMSDSLPSVIIDEPKAPSAPRHGGSDSSGFGSGKGEPTKGDYMTLAQKSPVKQQGQSPNGKALSSPSNAVLKESYFPKRALWPTWTWWIAAAGCLVAVQQPQ